MDVNKKVTNFYDTVKKDFFDSNLNRIVEGKEFGFLQDKSGSQNTCINNKNLLPINTVHKPKEKTTNKSDLQYISNPNPKNDIAYDQSDKYQFPSKAENTFISENSNSADNNYFYNIKTNITPGNLFLEKNTQNQTDKETTKIICSNVIRGSFKKPGMLTERHSNSISLERIKDLKGNNFDQIASELIIDLNVDEKLLADEYDTNQRFSRGLKVLSIKVRDIVYEQKRTTYKDVAEALIQEAKRDLWFDNNLKLQAKQEQNVRRRVYDALNVLIAADVFKKSGKNVYFNNNNLINSMPEKYQQSKKDFLQSKHESVSNKFHAQLDTNRKKKATLKSQLQKFVSLKTLMNRNSIDNKEKLVTQPFLAVKPSKFDSCQMDLEMDKTKNRLSQTSNNEILMFSEQQTLQMLDLAKSSFSTDNLVDTIKSNFPKQSNEILSILNNKTQL